ncbi:hypothetical protein B296_00011111 [Ensete ventricosum]|uniref:C2 domain-containing protein n=1 Tax=Ensete ventricosum TaxID=4639 RepID=A0A427AZ16_ENSVE|nr:hypothetical protein B296_00011111 [Ensete ventricosum]
MDIDFRWGGDLSIILAVEALVASLPIQVFTVIRVIFQLSEEIPCISAVVVALLAEMRGEEWGEEEEEEVERCQTGAGSGGQGPEAVGSKIGVRQGELELKPQGKLTVTIVKANDLKNQELVGKSDPYVVLFVRPVFKVKTKVVDDNLTDRYADNPLPGCIADWGCFHLVTIRNRPVTIDFDHCQPLSGDNGRFRQLAILGSINRRWEKEEEGEEKPGVGHCSSPVGDALRPCDPSPMGDFFSPCGEKERGDVEQEDVALFF